MSNRNILKISFIGHTGVGKTTCAKLINETYTSSINVKLAEPLYDLQSYFYKKIGKNIKGKQDGELLQFLGYKIHKEHPSYMANIFLSKVNNLIPRYTIITNDDCRPHNYKYLKEDGFLFVKLVGKHRKRVDHTNIDPSHIVEKEIDNLQCDYQLDNNGTINDFRDIIIRLIEEVRHEKRL